MALAGLWDQRVVRAPMAMMGVAALDPSYGTVRFHEMGVAALDPSYLPRMNSASSSLSVSWYQVGRP